ncbi:glycosyltransferase family 4 protein [Natronorubrum bangense]|uniref:Glycosyltransferase n=1 Tax=Natronorubrum bangense JCM 10635 TaxID=1227500 RepID=L9W2V9_9EURY|nr:glycosyltransferase family 4 protein [Natronorubrum bangense]ELY42658.1 glycosyltransferase [Natronorubrum bangense JCM 10635]
MYRYLQKLACSHDITLITFENSENLEDTDRFETLTDEVEAAGIEWHPLRYHRTPSLPATLWDLTVGFATAARIIRRQDIEIIHTRSYVPSVLGLLCKRLFGTQFVFDMRGFWADERVDGGMWDEGGRLYRTAKWFETQFLTHADVVISLTEAGIDAMQAFDHVDTTETRFEMIPTCADLELFTPQPEHREEEFVLGYVGSVGTWYLFDDVLECFELLRELRPGSRLKILNQGDHDYVYDRLAEFDIDESAVTLKAVDHEEVPAEMNRMDAGIFFYTPTFSKKGTSPTKMGEFLACGLPCLSNAAVGDVESILEDNGVGVALDSFDPEEKRQAVQRLVDLSTTPATAARCRQVAESYYSLERGVQAYDEIYRTVVDNG